MRSASTWRGRWTLTITSIIVALVVGAASASAAPGPVGGPPASGRVVHKATGEQTLCTGFNACNNAGLSNYGYQNVYTQKWWLQDAGHNCTNYVAYRFTQAGIGRPSWAHGGAAAWGDNAGAPVNSTVAVGAIAWWRSKGSTAGHVAIVQQVNADGSFITSDDVFGGDFHWRKYTPGGSTWPTGFIHLNDAALGGGGGNPTPTSNGGRPIQHPDGGRCMDVTGVSPNEGTRVQLWDCNGVAGQQWLRVGSTIRVYGNYDRCLDFASGVDKPNTAVQIWGCNGGGAQNWSINTDGTITSPAGNCLDATNAGTGNGTQLQLYECNGSAAQQWVGPVVGNNGRPVQHTDGGRCMDVPNVSTMMGTQVQLWDCNGGAAQSWVYDPASKTMRAYANLCLDVRGGAQVKSTPVQIWQCNGAPAQQWNVHRDGTITSAGGLCLDATGGGTYNGILLQLWDCSPNNLAQQWVGPMLLNAGHTVTHPAGGRCMDVSNAGTTLSTRVQLWDCIPDDPAQAWIYDRASKTFLVYANMCLDVAGGVQQKGTAVQVYSCNGADAQKWYIKPDGTIRSPGGLCLDATGYGTTNGTLLQLWDCIANNPAQQWVGGDLLNLSPPTVKGSPKVGKTLTARPGSWTPLGAAFSYQWYSNGAPISGATRATYTIPSSKRGSRLAVLVTARKPGYEVTTKRSAQTARIER